MYRFVSLTMLLAAACTFDVTNQLSFNNGSPDARSAADAAAIDGAAIDATASIDAGSPIEADAMVPEGCLGTLVDFEEFTQYTTLGVHGGMDFGDNWDAYNDGQFFSVTTSIAFGADIESEEFSFNGVKRSFRSLRVAWTGADTPTTVTISDPDHPGNPPIVVIVGVSAQSTDITTNWTEASGRILVQSNNGWKFFLDDICHEEP